MENFTKVVRIGTAVDNYRKLVYSIFCKIEFNDGRLSITGVEGPQRNGDAIGACGQIEMHLFDHLNAISPAPGWTRETLARFFNVWRRWHLNDMNAGTPAQEEYLRENPVADRLDYFTKASAALSAAGLNPDNGYKYGSKWLSEEVPSEVLDFLRSLPDTDVQPAWV